MQKGVPVLNRKKMRSPLGESAFPIQDSHSCNCAALYNVHTELERNFPALTRVNLYNKR